MMIDVLTHALGKYGAIRLNLGSGPNWKPPPEWINVDLWPSANPDLLMDACTLPGIEPNSVDEIYNGHLAEHLVNLRLTLARWYEVLKPGGILVTTVPEHRGVISRWKRGEGFMPYHASPYVGLYGAMTGFSDYNYYTHLVHTDPVAADTLTHHRSFDTETLMMVLELAGFVGLVELDTHPAMPDPLGWPKDCQVTVKAVKPL